MQVTVDGVSNGPMNSDVQFTFEIGNACEQDSLTISNHFPIVYNLRTPAQVHTDKLTISQTYNFCPYECTLNTFVLSTRTWEPYNIDIFTTWNPYTTDFTILTGDKTLNSVVMPMKVAC